LPLEKTLAKPTADPTHKKDRLLEVCKNLSANLEFEPLLHSIIEVASELTSRGSSSINCIDLAK
jgi:hypothetical protein